MYDDWAYRCLSSVLGAIFSLSLTENRFSISCGGNINFGAGIFSVTSRQFLNNSFTARS